MEVVSLLKDEYLALIDIVAGYDDRLMIIKGWSITVGVGLLGYAVTTKQRTLLVACMISAIAFAIVDAKVKEYQVAYYPRMQAIEGCIAAEQNEKSKRADELVNCTVLSIHKSWQQEKAWYGIVLQFAKFGVFMPHLLIFALAAFLYRRPELFQPNEMRS